MRLSCGKINTSFEHKTPKDFVQSQWQTREKSVVFLVYRWCIACFFIFSVFVSAATSAARGELFSYFIYLTHWNLVCSMISMVYAACLTTLYHMDRFSFTGEMNRVLKLAWFLSTSSNMFAFLVTLIYWSVLFKSEKSVVDLNNIVVHATNSLMVLINLAVIKQPERFGLFVYPLACGCIYLFFSWFYPFLGGKNKKGQDFIYPILDWKLKPIKALLVGVIITASGAITHFTLCGLQRARAKIHAKYFRKQDEKADIFTLTC